MTEQQALVLTIALVVAMVAVMLLFAMPNPECRCRKCAFHTNEARMKREERRVERHRNLHRDFNLAWPHDRCAECKAGNVTDRPA